MGAEGLGQAAREALRPFPLDAARITGVLEAGAINHNLLVEDAEGSRYVLRDYLRGFSPERASHVLRLQRHFGRLGFPVAEVVPARSGALCVEAGGTLWALQRFVEGEEYDSGRIGQAREAGRRLAPVFGWGE